jgi:hypothetical protein
MSPPALLTRKDIAAMLGISVDMVRKNEKNLGLKSARADINTRTIRYLRPKVESILAGRGLLSATRY